MLFLTFSNIQCQVTSELGFQYALRLACLKPTGRGENEMKLKALTTLLLLSFATFALASDCDGLYQGKQLN